jgi:hypothetical protein
VYFPIDWTKRVPSDEAIRSMWKKIIFSAVEPRLQTHPFLTALGKINNFEGNIVFQQLKGPTDPTFEWFASRNRLPEINFFERFLQSPLLSTSFNPEPEPPTAVYAAKFEMSSGFTLAGLLATDLFWGGTTLRFRGEATEAKVLGDSFSTALIEDRFDEVTVYRTSEAWSSWFNEQGGDFTYLIVDKGTALISLLAFTDSA